ncbi:ScaI family restriction endonuclease [Subtercola sp. Z020]|uniref:ScaI family restriction endonuclease n=1 Tax=Subtercola sp. Z020 TaxID=2080582 RepID=UPI000CE87690|nr:ScaI family restriction endonuclease [Subtercola sp. Z020]PPF82976.1 ScaI family restriction endonuclease [Subtercola sp. Z020]
MTSIGDDPYSNSPEELWPEITRELVDAYPLSLSELKDVVLDSWTRILSTRIGNELQIGEEYKPSPQMMGNFLHNMIPIVLERAHPAEWRKDDGRFEKDLVYLPDRQFDTEIKTSSQRGIFANRSYAQPSAPGAKEKSGYYLAINFEKFVDGQVPCITMVRLGWLSHRDWIPQASATGQAASLAPITYRTKFVSAL